MGKRNFNLREGTEKKSVTLEAVLQPIGSLGFGIPITCAWSAMERLLADQIPSTGMMMIIILSGTLA